MNFFTRKPQTQTRTHTRPIGPLMWNVQLPEEPRAVVPEEPRAVVPEVLGPDRPRSRVPVAAGYLDIDVQCTHVPETPMHPYQEPTFTKIFQHLLTLGWDLPAKHATVLVRVLGSDKPRTLEEEFLVTRYLRAMGQQS